MQRMTGIDPMFIYSDTPETPMEIAYACVFDPATRRRWLQLRAGHRPCSQTRIPTLQPFRRRLMPVPLGLDHPRWVDDPDFDLANHLHRVALPAPGGEAEFRAKVAEVMGRPLTPGAAALGDARRRGDGRRHGRADRQGAPLRHRRRGRRRDAGQAARPDARGQRRHRAVPALGPGRPALADAVDDRRAAELHPQPDPGAARRARSRPHRRAAGPLRGRTTASARCRSRLGAPDTFESPVGARRAVVLRRAGHGGGARAEGRASGRRSTTSCSPSARARSARIWPRTVRTSRARWSPSCRCRCAATRTARRLGNQLSAMFVPLSNDRKTPLERLRTVTAASASCKGQERAVGLRPDGHAADRGRAAGAGQADDPARGALGRAAQAARRQPHDLQRARSGLPALLRGHGAAGGVPARTGRSTGWR